jgi:hypothetical protein
MLESEWEFEVAGGSCSFLKIAPHNLGFLAPKHQTLARSWQSLGNALSTSSHVAPDPSGRASLPGVKKKERAREAFLLP